MATAKTYYARPSHRFLDTDQSYFAAAADPGFEFDESDLYASAGSNHSDSPDSHRKISKSIRSVKKPSNRPSSAVAPSSLPINVPDWAKILRKEQRDSHRKHIEVHDGDFFDASGGVLPPHEYLAKTRMASFSVHEGVGRTLKGRDLSRVRNAIFEIIGYQD